MYPFRSPRRYGALLILFLATSGCATSTGPQNDAVDAVSREQDIAITNRTRRDIYTFVVGREAAARINWAPCVSGPSCVPLPPGETRRAPFTTAQRIASAEREVLVYWWHSVRGPDGTRGPGSIQVEIVPLSD